VRSLGLKRIRHTVVVEDSPETRGYVQAVGHLVLVETVDAVSEAAGAGDTEAKD
jgi:large subunit ribosomal protein L30